MLAWRFAVSAVLIPLLVFVFYLDAHVGCSGLYLLILSEILAIRSVWECTDLFRDRSKRLQLPIIFSCAAAIVFAGWIPHLKGDCDVSAAMEMIALVYSFAVLLLCASEAARFRGPGGNIETLGTEILIVSYVGVLLAITTQLRWVAGMDAGYLVLGSLVVCAKGGDVGAFSVGKIFGKRKLAPHLSPGKTLAGGVGAFLGAGICGLLWLQFATPLFDSSWTAPPWYFSVIYGCIIGVVGLVGDLVESFLKREAGKKDSAALFPGFGGLLDVLDSVIYAGPAAYLLWKVLPLATWAE
ncbi:Phosphatidate cytidylyltransferase [Thalassoglobus neptunius]|uniref:Phosphatidate cytidylyltransferase n=1 Tax=Thalassoglobus neptunius TaxID=1938619 RepID=A0A5C5X3U6_9PLAN|nr:phosphatidate cytidylyltransferase [Thalassoglobus neptunius]TWT57478.1 Phosphatidate cytidylyltransferase [Thalassoglobus neptunius]